MNIYNRIKAVTASNTGIPQYFIACYNYQYVFNQQALTTAFSELCQQIYPRLEAANNTHLPANSLSFVASEQPALDAEQAISLHYSQQVQKAKGAPVIATVYYDAAKQQSLLCYYFNHVYLDVAAAKILHLGLIQLYKNQNGISPALEKAHCMDDADFIKDCLAKFQTNHKEHVATMAQELAKGMVQTAAWVRAKRLMFNRDKHGERIRFQRFQLKKSAIQPENGVSGMAQLSAAIAMAYMQSFNCSRCHFVVPVDLRQRRQKWLLGNPIAGVFIKLRADKTLAQQSLAVQASLDSYLNRPVLYWLYQLVMLRMRFLSDKSVFKKAWHYSEKSHFISTHLGNILRVNSQFSEPVKASCQDAYIYSYPLQNSIGVSLAVTQFDDNITINLSASEHAFLPKQQRQFANSLQTLLNTQVALLRPCE